MTDKRSWLLLLAGVALALSFALWGSFASYRPAETARASASPVPAESAYVLREFDGCIAIFCGVENEAPASVTDIEVGLLPARDRELLRDGIGVSGGEELSRLLEDLGS